MFRVTFAIFYGFLYTISLLPIAIWYLISDFLYVILYYVIGYRKKIAYTNLKRCFPEKSEEELITIMKKSYRHTCDVFVEFFKEISMSEAELKRRMHVVNPEMFQQIEERGKGVLALATHYGNFEWITTRTVTSSYFTCCGVYAPIGSRYFDELAHRTRRRWGGELIPAKNAIQNVWKRLDDKVIIGFICDQTPSRAKVLYFTEFFGQVTAVHDKFAHLALQKQVDVYFFAVKKIKRGYYSMELTELPMQDFQPYCQANVNKFTDYHVKLLENLIISEPAYWLWTHKRWKHEPKEGDILSEKLLESRSDIN